MKESLFIYDTEVFIAQLKCCLLNCFDWVPNFLCVVGLLMITFWVMTHYALQNNVTSFILIFQS